MPVPSEGALQLYGDIYTNFNDFSQGDNSLHSASIYAGFSTPDAMSDFYGYVDAILPSVTTNSATSVGTTSMTLNGNITDDGGGTISERGFYHGTNSSAAANNTKYAASGTATGNYSLSRTGLNSNTTYYFWAYVINEVGETIGSRVTQATDFQYTYAAAILGASQSDDWASYPNAYVRNYNQSINGPYQTIHTFNGGPSYTFTNISMGTNRTNRTQAYFGGGGAITAEVFTFSQNGSYQYSGANGGWYNQTVFSRRGIAHPESPYSTLNANCYHNMQSDIRLKTNIIYL